MVEFILFLLCFLVITLCIAAFARQVKAGNVSVSKTDDSDSKGLKDVEERSDANPVEDGSELRGNFAPVSLPSIDDEQFLALKNVIKNCPDELDSLPGAIVPVVGGAYRTKAAQEVFVTLKFGDKILLKIDPDNEFDDTAVRVYAKRCHIGFVPAEYSCQIYWYCVLDKIVGCYVIHEQTGEGFRNLKFVMFFRPDEPEDNP